jgi:teichuronic acid biosynthesis glycosyltransferase TuaC
VRILFICSGTGNKEPSPVVISQANSLIANGYEIDFFLIKEKGFKGYFKSVGDLRKHLKNSKLEILHAHYGLCGIIALLARRSERLVVSFMGDDILGSNRSDGSVKWTSLLLARFNIFLSKWFYNHSIVKSEEMLMKMHDKKATLIPNGVDSNIFSPGAKTAARKKIGLDSQLKLIIFVSDPSRQEKNYSLADEAINLIKDQAVLLLPVVNCSHNILADYYNAADVLLLTSFHEGSPNVIKEAMACNCPIVSTDVGDVKWVIAETEGCYITTFSPDGVSEKIRMAINFRELHRQTAGRKRIFELGLDSETTAKKIIKVYNIVLQDLTY